MATEQVATYAITTATRVKDRLGLKTVDHDIVLNRIISAITDFLEGECGGRRFKETAYVNEVHSVYNRDYILLKHAPVSTITSFQYRAGTVSTPNWTNFIADDYELMEDGKSGIIKVYGGLVRGINQVRVSYTAGYKIDFSNAGDTTLHTLPHDLADLADRLVIKLFKKRESEGRSSESFQGSLVNWKELLDTVDQQLIARYRRLPQFVG